jgi:hypothetical protein
LDPDQNELFSGEDTPFAFRMLENMPGIASSIGFAQYRGSNTLLRGGFMDNRMIGPGKLGGFTKSGQLVNPTSKAFYGSSARRARLASGQAVGKSGQLMPLGKGFRVNHITARPRALTRYNSLAMFNAAENTRFYSPFQMAAKMGGNRAVKNEAFKKAIYGAGGPAEGEQVFQRGMLSMITAGRRADLLETRATGRFGGRAAAKVAKAQEQVKRLAMMNNPALLQGKSTVQVAAGMRTAPIGMANTSPAQRLAAARAAGPTATMSPMAKALSGGPQVGLTGNLLASAGATEASRYMQGYFRGALGHMNAGGLTDDAMRGAGKAVSHLSDALGGNKMRVSGRALEQGVFKTLGVKRTMQAAATKKGAMVLGARTAAMAIPGLNLIATASLVYDLGKMGGEVVKSGINLAKDAVKSMKGSIDKPMFGMGYKDNEVSATSRARGVMAIQNSRLNARSALGSEGAMMASHFG